MQRGASLQATNMGLRVYAIRREPVAIRWKRAGENARQIKKVDFSGLALLASTFNLQKD